MPWYKHNFYYTKNIYVNCFIAIEIIASLSWYGTKSEIFWHMVYCYLLCVIMYLTFLIFHEYICFVKYDGEEVKHTLKKEMFQ